jgi:hypothetical protein
MLNKNQFFRLPESGGGGKTSEIPLTIKGEGYSHGFKAPTFTYVSLGIFKQRSGYMDTTSKVLDYISHINSPN